MLTDCSIQKLSNNYIYLKRYTSDDRVKLKVICTFFLMFNEISELEYCFD